MNESSVTDFGKTILVFFQNSQYSLITYALLGDGLTQNFFSVNQDNGVINIIRDLTSDDAYFYTVIVVI